MRILSLTFVALALTGCMRDTPHNAPVTNDEATRIAEQAEASFTSGDLNAIMSHYANGAVMFDASHAGLTTDRKVQASWAQSFISMKPADYHVPDRQVQILGPDAFISSGTEVFTVAAGAARPTVSARFTDIFKRQKDGSWKIVNEHVSMPPSTAPAAR